MGKRMFLWHNEKVKNLLGKTQNVFKRKWVKWIAIAILFVILSVGADFLHDLVGGGGYYSYNDDYGYYNDSCNVLGINIHGSIYTYIPTDTDGNSSMDYSDAVSSEDIIYMLKGNKNDPNIKAVIVEVDSPGGSAVAGEEISDAIKDFGRPSVAFIRDLGDSAGYMAISGVDKIFASKFSDVGSIGVTMSYLSNVHKNQKEGYIYEQLSSGKFKDSGDPNKVLTNEEKALFERDLKIMHEDFIKIVAENRNLPIEAVRKLADGSTMLGEQAKENGLIDEIGGVYEAENYLGQVLGKKVEVCW